MKTLSITHTAHPSGYQIDHAGAMPHPQRKDLLREGLKIAQILATEPDSHRAKVLRKTIENK